MIKWTRSARIVPGKMLQAMPWGKEIAEYVNNKSVLSKLAGIAETDHQSY